VNVFETKLHEHGLALRRSKTEILQINVGKLCNQTCTHCHVNAGPGRKEIVSRETLDRIIGWLEQTDIPTVDITGGAPEVVPDFRHLVRRIKALVPTRHIKDRCNLTVFFEPGQQDLPAFLAENHVEIIASLPCYSKGNVDEQRGDGVFDKSVRALKILNNLGYGLDPELPLHLVYNPIGISLPGPQAELEKDYHDELLEKFGIRFNSLYTITNMPIARFASFLRANGEYESYLSRLEHAFNPDTVEGLMCRSTLNIGWRGEVYDCDFNQMLDMQWHGEKPLYLWDIDPKAVEEHPIMTGAHCLGCTAGAGSSCGGALT
jgi:radical SAM/Cys-rich protein